MSADTLEKPKISDSDTTPGKRHVFCGVCNYPMACSGEPYVGITFCGVEAPGTGKRFSQATPDHCDKCVKASKKRCPTCGL